MIIKINYNKLDGTIIITDDETLMETVVTKITDTDEELSLEIALNTSAYQSQFEEIEINGDDN
jgi:ATPase subunit of ABC transporter with duplicated ATPase domains